MLNIESFMGIIFLWSHLMAGFGVSNSILLEDFANEGARHCSKRRKAVLDSARIRMRPRPVTTPVVGPILLALTALAPLGGDAVGDVAVSALLPLLLALGVYELLYLRKERNAKQ
jgi:multidrug efflux pump subunit AcrB